MTIHFQAKHPTGFTVNSPLQPVVFPDGAVHVSGAYEETRYDYQIADVRGLSHDDLFVLGMWSEACEQRREAKVLILPYLPGARMDRGVPNGAAVYGSYISSFVAPDQIITIDPHSPDALRSFFPTLGRETTVFPVERIIRKALQDPSRDDQPQKYVGVIAPDKGAHERASRAAHVMGVPVYQAGKTRDFNTGKLSGFHMEDELPAEGKLLIVDDLCDGGGTFIGLAEATGLPKERLDLWVTHGVFSKGVNVLEPHFGEVHTTDSYYSGPSLTMKDDERDGKRAIDFKVVVHPLTPYLYPEIDHKRLAPQITN
ncbi:phosphoribosyl pyrophosphate transferase [Microbacterium phage Cece]|nr:phosphoribosyl pyrophosphate transferase [Microbacterium phage Cece]